MPVRSLSRAGFRMSLRAPFGLWRRHDVHRDTGAAGALGSAVARHLAQSARTPTGTFSLFDLPEARPSMDVRASDLGRPSLVRGLDLVCAAEWESVANSLANAGGAPTHVVLTAGGWQGGTPLHANAKKRVASYEAMVKSNLDPCIRPSCLAPLHGRRATRLDRSRWIRHSSSSVDHTWLRAHGIADASVA